MVARPDSTAVGERGPWAARAVAAVVGAAPAHYLITRLLAPGARLDARFAAVVAAQFVVVLVAAALPRRARTPAAVAGLAAATLVLFLARDWGVDAVRAWAFGGASAGVVAGVVFGRGSAGRAATLSLLVSLIAYGVVWATRRNAPDKPPGKRPPVAHVPLPPFDPMAVRLAGLSATVARSERHELDRPGGHVVRMGGALDASMTADPIGDEVDWAPRCETGVALTLENVGAADATDVTVSVNGRVRPMTTETLAKELGLPRGPAIDVARGILHGLGGLKMHAGSDPAMWDPAALADCYGFALCGEISRAAATLAKARGVDARLVLPVGHAATEMLVDGRWVLVDCDQGAIYLDWDNRTPISSARAVQDPALIEREGILPPYPVPQREVQFVAGFYQEKLRTADADVRNATRPALRLRPGESIAFRWDRARKCASSRAPFGMWARSVQQIRNGEWLWRAAPADLVRGAAVPKDWTAGDALSLAPGAKSGVLVAEVATPYPIVGGDVSLTVEGGTTAGARLEGTCDGETWTTLFDFRAGDCSASLDALPATLGAPTHLLKLRLTARRQADGDAVSIRGLRIRCDLQMARSTLPDLRLDDNQVEVAWNGETKFAVVHEWRETDGVERPKPPADVATSADPQRDVVVRWTGTLPAPAAVHVQVSDRDDAAWPARPSFDSLTETVETEWKPPRAGLFARGVSYRARVRVRDARGVWSEWAASPAFTVDAPEPSTARLDGGTLTWPADDSAVAWEVHGSNARSFLPLDEPAVRVVKAVLHGKYDLDEIEEPSTLLARVDRPSWRLDEARPCAYYRVRAVSQSGARGGFSDVVAAERPRLPGTLRIALRAGARQEVPVAAAVDAGRLEATHRVLDWPDEVHEWSYENSGPAAVDWSLSGAPAFASVKSGTLTLAPGAGDVGRHAFKLLVAQKGADGTRKSASMDVEVEVGR